MAIEIVSFPIKNGGSFHSYVTVYQRVFQTISSQGGLPEVPEMVQSILTTSTSTASWAASLGRAGDIHGIHEESWFSQSFFSIRITKS